MLKVKHHAAQAASIVASTTSLCALVFCLLTSTVVTAEPIGLMERYALAADREAMLRELIPGSDDHYFYHCLNYQTSGQLDRAETVLRDWLAEHKGRATPLITNMIDRQRLLTYRDTPQKTIDYLVRRLGVKLEHPAPAVEGERRFASELDQSLLAADRLVNEALQRNDGLKIEGLKILADRFLSDKAQGISISLKDFLGRVDGPYVERVDELVIKELKSRPQNERRFGDLRAHAQLTLEELRAASTAVPEIADDNEMVAAVLKRLRPGADGDPSQQEALRLSYLREVESYTRGLPPSYSSLQAAATFRLLEANLAAGEFDRDLFLRYLKLPRVSPLVHRDWAKRPQVKAKLNDNFMDLALLPPVGDEQPLVRAYLEHFLKDERNTDGFATYLQPDYLRRVFAETKLLHGIGAEDQWYKMLSGSERKAIRDSVELRLAAQNPRRFPSEGAARLLLDIKNVDEVVVRIYEINLSSYYRTHERPLDTDIDLDGLVPTHERKIGFDQSAVRRHREAVSLPEIEGRGVWIIDLVGKGVRARAMIRRGEIHHVDSSGPDGMVFTIIDENRKPIAAATMWVGSREFVADDEGRVVLPPVSEAVSRRAIISDGDLAEPFKFSHLRERYSLDVGMHTDRTQLQSGGAAKLLMRARLRLADTPIDPQTLTDVSVRIAAVDLDGISTTNRIDGVELDQNGELVIPIRIPSRLARLSATLSGKIDGLSDGKQQTLQGSHSWDISGIRKTNHTHDAFLTRDGDQYVIEVRGRSGEPVAGAAIRVVLSTDYRNAPVEQTLQCDDSGRVSLGSLPAVSEVRYGVVSGLQHRRDLRRNLARWPSVVHTRSSDAVRLAIAEPELDVTRRYRLVERRGGALRRDLSDQLSTSKGLLVIAPLPAGDYQLVDRRNGRRTGIVVVEGPAIDGVAVGETRHRSLAPAMPIGIASIDHDDEGMKIRLSGETEAARVHVYASRYMDAAMPLNQLSLPIPRLYGRRLSLPRCGYVSDLRLGDEYQYVLRRRYATKYPGVMLPLPGVILNPWETEETTNSSQSAQPGAVPPASAAPAMADAAMAAKEAAGAESAVVGSDYDFLKDPGTALFNLRPDADGVVAIPADVLKGLPLIQIVVSDPVNLLQRVVTSPAAKVETSDLRLAESLDVSNPFRFERAVTVVSRDRPLDLKQLGSAQLQVYASVGNLMKLYQTLVNDPRLAEFDVLSRWHTLEPVEKMAAYTRLASHELHLFLWAHDRGFFEEVIQPYLQNKQEKQFVDHWLLGNDLSQYADLWRYNQLNAAERVLLSMREPDLRDSIRRELSEQVAKAEEDPAAIRRLIESALKDSGLAAGRAVKTRSIALGVQANDFAFGAMSMSGNGVAGSAAAKRLQVEKLEEESLNRYKFNAKNMRGLYRGRRAIGGGGAAFFRDLDSTKQWAESQWDRTRTVGGPAASTLITANAFWADLAASEGEHLRVSSHLLRPVGNRHSVLIALAMSGLPLAPGDVDLPSDPDQPYAPEHAVAVVTKRLRSLKPADNDGGVLIGQRFEASQRPSGSASQKTSAEPNEFLTGVAYRGQTVVSNPTAVQRTVDVFWQIPAGSLPLAGSQATDSRTVVLKPFAVESIEYQFYFPSAGEFEHYPANVSSDETLIAQASQKTFTVVDRPSQSDEVTWESVARAGSAEEVAAFLQTANLRDLDWMLVAHRMQDQELYRVITGVLRDAKLPIAELWAYAFRHRDEAGMRTFLSVRADLVGRVGPVLDSTLLTVEPIERRTHELLEYAPLVRARIHRLGEENEILNPTFLKQYRGFVRVIGFDDKVSHSDRLILATYLLLQNRIEEAIEAFGQVERGAVDAKLQYDYVDAYLALHQERFEQARKAAVRHANHPVPRWNQRFSQLLAQLDQRSRLNQTEQLVSADNKSVADKPIPEGSGDLAVMDRERRQESASEQQPEVIVRVEGDSLRIDHRRAREVTVNLYGVDLELLFSKAPFVREDLQRMAMVRPSRSEPLKFEQATGVGRFELDDNLRRQTLLVEVVAGASRSTALYYGGEMTTYVSESYGQLQTTDATSHRPLATAYVKVYAKYPDGSVRFYKDGYTDARGRFDYASVSANDAKGATRFAILVMSDEKGATLHDVATPTQ